MDAGAVAERVGRGESKARQNAFFDSLILTFSRREKGLSITLNSYKKIC